jgi:pyruvate dehydrogenase E1 component alpha subunit
MTEVIEKDKGLRLLESLLRIRRMEERCAQLYMQEKIRGFLHLYIGEEAIAAGVMEALEPDEAVVATYREHGHALLKGVGMKCILAEMYGKVTGCSRGRGGSMHLFSREHRFYGGNAIVGGGLPMAVGLALADKMQGNDRATVCFFGEGASAEGEFHEALNLAALWELPVLFCCENNLYAMGTALDRSESQPDIHLKASAYNVVSKQVDGMDVIACEAAARHAVEAIRHGAGPHFLEFKTYRFRAHSMFDAELYREKSEVQQWKERDPIPRFIDELRQRDLVQESEVDAIEKRIAEEIEAAVEFAEQSEWESLEDLERFVYSERQG